jgi:hypothetical protein
MRRCIHEYTTKNKRSITSEEGKTYVKEIIIAHQIETLIKDIIKESKCKIPKTGYNTSLINAITQMYEVNSKIFII